MRSALILSTLAFLVAACDGDGVPFYCPQPEPVDCTGGVHVDDHVVLDCPFIVECEPGTLPESGSVDFYVGDTPVSFRWDQTCQPLPDGTLVCED